MGISNAIGVWLRGRATYEVVSELLQRTVKVWGLVDVYARTRPLAVFVRLGEDVAPLPDDAFVLHDFAVAAMRELKLDVYELDGSSGHADDVWVRRLDSEGGAAWRERAEDAGVPARFAKEAGTGKARLFERDTKAPLAPDGAGWRHLGTVALETGPRRAPPRPAPLPKRLSDLQEEREPALLEELTAALEDGLVSADERVAELSGREFDGAVRVRSREESKAAARKLPENHPARLAVFRGGLLADVQLFLKEGKGERKLTGVVPLELPPSRLGPIDEAAVVAALDESLRALLKTRNLP